MVLLQLMNVHIFEKKYTLCVYEEYNKPSEFVAGLLIISRDFRVTPMRKRRRILQRAMNTTGTYTDISHTYIYTYTQTRGGVPRAQTSADEWAAVVFYN